MRNPTSVFDENKQEICNAICEALQYTANAGSIPNNNLIKFEYHKENGKEVVYPIFADGTGKNGEFYPINITGDSGTAIFKDIVKQFINPMW